MAKTFADSYVEYEQALNSTDNRPIFRTEAYGFGTPIGRTHQMENNITVKSDYNYSDYSIYSPSDATSQYIEDIIAECMYVYRKEPIIHQTIDLMSDFGSQGVRVVCADKRQEKFGHQWAEFVNLQEFSDKFLRTLYLGGTVVVKEIMGKVPLKTQRKWKSSVADHSFNERAYTDPEEMNVEVKEIDVRKATMPLKWIIHDPRAVYMVGGMLASFIGKPIVGLRINAKLRNELMQLPKLAEDSEQYKQYFNMIPTYVLEAIGKGAMFFPLDQDKISVHFYKKDDWEVWGKPLIEPILRDIKMYNKLKLADMSALDGAISSVRLWRLGSLEHNVVPTKAALDKLRGILSQNVAGGTMDFVWGPDLDFKESSTNLYQFLGPQKYEATLAAIYAGLGIPSGLTGGSSSASATNGYVGLKTLIERLKYGRNVLLKFLTDQLKKVQESMGFKKPFKVVFDQLVLTDEAAQKTLLLQMWDRDLISDETIRYLLDLDQSDIEEAKIARQNRKRGKSLPHKSSPFANLDADLTKIFAQKGIVTPDQVGINLPESDKETPVEQTHRFNIEKTKTKGANKSKGDPLMGRPIGSNDENPRKKRRFVPKGASASYSDLFLYTEKAKEKIDEMLTASYLAVVNKKNVRSLSTEETNSLELIKFTALSNLKPHEEVTTELIAKICTMPINNDIYSERGSLVYKFVDKFGRAPNVQEKRKIECEAFVNKHF